jgi:two-component system LytT family sensor kinase
MLAALSDDATAAHAKLPLRTVAILAGVVWLAHLSVIVASSLPLGSSGALPFQLARILIALGGGSLCLLVHALSPAEGHANYAQHFVRVLALCVPAALLLTVYSHFQFAWLAPPGTPERELWSDIAFSWAYYLWIFVSWAAFYVGFHAMRDSQTRARQLAEIEARAHLSQLSALRYQLNPHFFFNVLNTLSGLVNTRRLNEAEQVIIRMADFLRYSLRSGPAELVTLDEELAAQRAYLEIEKVRFGDRLNVAFEIPRAFARALVPALILQPLVENAVKHAMARSEAPVWITIGAASEHGVLRCWVENTPSTDSAPERDGLGVGLRNVMDRLQATFGAAASLEAQATTEGGWRSTISLPLQERNDAHSYR